MLGLTEEEVDDGCPYDFKPYENAQKLKVKHQNNMMYIQGVYFIEALFASVGNMLRGKSTETFKYPEEPFDLFGDESKEIDVVEETKKLFQRLEIMQKNFELNKEDKGDPE